MAWRVPGYALTENRRLEEGKRAVCVYSMWRNVVVVDGEMVNALQERCSRWLLSTGK